MMDPYREAFTAEVRKVRLNPPQIPFSSQQVPGSPQNRQPIHPIGLDTRNRRFADGRQELAKTPDQVLLEVPGNTLSTLALHPAYEVPDQVVLFILRPCT